jgi:Na+-driven multidrug efflux pump
MTALAVSALTQPLAALAFVYDGLILGISDYKAMRRAMLLAILAYLPMAALTVKVHALGLPGIWIALGCWLAARAGILARRWSRYVTQPDTRPG